MLAFSTCTAKNLDVLVNAYKPFADAARELIHIHDDTHYVTACLVSILFTTIKRMPLTKPLPNTKIVINH